MTASENPTMAPPQDVARAPRMPGTLMPPANVTWPMVAYALIREAPYLFMIASGCIMGVVLVAKANANELAGLGAAIAPIVVAALAKSQPAESQTLMRMVSGDLRK